MEAGRCITCGTPLVGNNLIWCACCFSEVVTTALTEIGYHDRHCWICRDEMIHREESTRVELNVVTAFTHIMDICDACKSVYVSRLRELHPRWCMACGNQPPNPSSVDRRLCAVCDHEHRLISEGKINHGAVTFWR